MKDWDYYGGITSEKYARNVIEAYLSDKQGIKWIGSMLEFWSSSEELINNAELRKQELTRVIKAYGGNKKQELLNEMNKRKLI